MACISCSEKEPENQAYRIGIEPSWHVLNLGQDERNVRAFTKELIQAVGRLENMSIETVNISQDENLKMGFENGDYNAIISTLSLEGRGAKQYTFSKNYLPLGPLLVIREGSEFKSLDEMPGKIVGIPRDSSIVYDVKINPSIVIRYYDHINEAIEHLIDHDVDGIILGIFTAYGFTQNLYKGRLVVQEAYLNDLGLRLATIKGSSNEEFISRFNKALSTLKANGEFLALIKKWKIPYNPSADKDLE
ncbi:MAG: glutamine transport system substrate-binding protein [Chlamydiales bacterium]|jgi:glutamine transport system substrate-binding protein